MTIDKLRFTCEECKGTDFTEADGLIMAVGFVCTECLYATSEEVHEEFINDPAHVGVDLNDLFHAPTKTVVCPHPLETMFPEGMTHEEAHSVQAMNEVGAAISEHNKARAKRIAPIKKKRDNTICRLFFIALMILTAVVLFVSFAPPANAMTETTEVMHDLCLDGTWTHDPDVDGFVCVKDNGTYYPPEG